MNNETTVAIDHKAEALYEIERARIVLPRDAEAGSPLTAEALGMAQVHATLYLAEQQRIANVIALARLEVENGGTAREAFDAVFATAYSGFSGQSTIRPEIREGLGVA